MSGALSADGTGDSGETFAEARARQLRDDPDHQAKVAELRRLATSQSPELGTPITSVDDLLKLREEMGRQLPS